MSLKIPPLALTCLFMAFMWGLFWFFPQFSISIPKNIIISILLAIIGSLFSVLGVALFRGVGTTVNPTTPDKVSSLVITGIYRVSRNPMYVGFFFFLLAWGCFLSHLLSLLLFPVIFIVYMNYFQIPQEEKALQRLFGEEFTLYKNEVRRWL